MNDEAAALRAAWMSEAADNDDSLQTIADRILDKDRTEHVRERRMRIGGIVVMSLFVPILIWAAAHGVAPLVRAAYALMAVGCVAGVVAEWLYLDWSRRALPGPHDTRSQLQRTAFMLDHQQWLGRTAVLWSSPVFAGVILICVWLYRERTLAASLTVGALAIAAWIVSGVLAARYAAGRARRGRQLEEVLADLDEDR